VIKLIRKRRLYDRNVTPEVMLNLFQHLFFFRCDSSVFYSVITSVFHKTLK